MLFLTPAYAAVGGVIKIFDYVRHSLDLGHEVTICCAAEPDAAQDLFAIPRFTELLGDPRVTFVREVPHERDWAFFSWPPQWEQLGRSGERVIHLVQNTRHANPAFLDGYALRLLAEPLARIMVAPQVEEACRPYVNQDSLTETIVAGHDWPFFHLERTEPVEPPVNVAYTTWKSDVGVAVEQALAADPRFRFASIRDAASWQQLRDLYDWADVFLCCPHPQEGVYLAGLEALAAGCLIVAPDVGGNRVYCRFGENCLEVGYERCEDYVAALDAVAGLAPDQVRRLREAGYAILPRHTLARERAEFADFLRKAASPAIGERVSG